MRKAFVLGALILTTACGGESASNVGSGGTGSGGTGSGGTASGGAFAWPSEKPSFVLSIEGQDKSLSGSGFDAARLDFHAVASGFEAAVSSKLASAVGCSVSVDSKSVTVSGCAKQDSRTLTQLVLERAADGQLTGSFEAVSSFNGLFQGDIILNETTKFWGSVAFDTEPPVLEVNASGALPWSGIQISASEGVDEQAIVTAVSVVAKTGTAPTLTWKAEPGNPAWAGTRSLVGTFSDWTALSDGPSFDLALEGVPDLNGNASALVKTSVSALAVGKAELTHGFDAGVLGIGATGNAALETGQNPGVCEAGGCARIGVGDACHGAGGALVGLLDTAGKTKVRVRSRLVSSEATLVPKFTLSLFTPSGEKTQGDVGSFDAAATPPVQSLGFGQSFGDDVLALPKSAGIVGFQLTLPAKNDGGFCNMSPGPDVILIVESIAAE
ncbi:MAG: hypothetical protein U0263_41960 [Polyangiaceae bacterium]